jgi:hypothetical protein
LQTSLYQSQSGFYSGAEKAREGSEGDAVDQSTDRAFRNHIAQAKAKALALVNRNKKDVDALYFLGAVYGVLGGYEASTARKFFAALRNGSRCVDLHQQVVKLKPDYHDAYLSIGLYDYIVGSLPFPLKALAAIGGIRGNKSRGIQELQQAVENGICFRRSRTSGLFRRLSVHNLATRRKDGRWRWRRGAQRPGSGTGRRDFRRLDLRESFLLFARVVGLAGAENVAVKTIPPTEQRQANRHYRDRVRLQATGPHGSHRRFLWRRGGEFFPFSLRFLVRGNLNDQPMPFLNYALWRDQ